MAEKVSTLVVTLKHGCFTKILKTVCKLQETEDIRAISYDEWSRTVTISGAFDPLVLPCKLRRKAGCLIRDIQLVAAELTLTPQPPLRRPLQRPGVLLPNPSGGLAAVAPSCCGCGDGCAICWCGGYYGGCYCSCQAEQACAFVNHPPPSYHAVGLPLGQYPKNTCDCEDASSSPACSIM